MDEAEILDGMSSPKAEAPAGYRVMKVVVISLGLLIVLALGALIAGLVLKPASSSQAPSAASASKPPFNISITMPPGTQVTEASLAGDRLLLHLRTTAGEAVVILDATDGREIGRVNAAIQASSPPANPP